MFFFWSHNKPTVNLKKEKERHFHIPSLKLGWGHWTAGVPNFNIIYDRLSIEAIGLTEPALWGYGTGDDTSHDWQECHYLSLRVKRAHAGFFLFQKNIRIISCTQNKMGRWELYSMCNICTYGSKIKKSQLFQHMVTRLMANYRTQPSHKWTSLQLLMRHFSRAKVPDHSDSLVWSFITRSLWQKYHGFDHQTCLDNADNFIT